jgi:serralysin
VIEALGVTKLDLVGSHFSFDPVSGGSGPVLKYDGAALTAGGQWGAWTPIGAEATAGGYEVALKYAGADLYTVWNTDSNGNITTNTIGGVSGSSTALQTLETSFHQDLNGDGVIGVPTPQSPGVAPGPVSQPPAVTIASNDTFVFGRGGAVGNGGGNADPVEHFGSSVTAGQLAALFHETSAGQPQTVFQPINDAHDTIVNSGDHFGQMIADLHTSSVFIH